MWSRSQLNKLRQLGWSEWGLLLEATAWLAGSRLALLLLPFQRIAPRLGKLQHESDPALSSATEQTAARVGWAVRAAARRTPWESACLAQAMSAKGMLRRRHISSTLYLGLAKDKRNALQAHAWLRCGADILTGQAGHERYTILSSFAEEILPSGEQTSRPPTNSTETGASPNVSDILLAVLKPVPEKETSAQLRQLCVEEWEALVKSANSQHVLTLFSARLQALDVQTAVPPHLWATMQQQQQQVTLHNLSMYRELRQIQQTLQAENIPLIVLKGAFLATAVYPQIGQRMIGDLDILVPEDRVLQVAQRMRELGWKETQPFTMQAVRQHRHHLPTFAKAGVNFPVEIHWNIVRPLHNNKISPAELWLEPAIITVAGTEIAGFPPHLQLLHLALHAAYNHQFAFDLRSLCDIALLIAQQEAHIDWQQVVAKAQAWQWQRGVYLTLRLVQEFWDTAVPAQVLSQLEPNQIPENLIPLARQHLLWGRNNNFGITPNFAQLKGNKSVLGKAAFIVSFIFPTRAFLSSRYGVSPQSSKVWLYYFINFRDLLKRNIRRTWQLLRGQRRVTEAVERRNLLAEWLGIMP